MFASAIDWLRGFPGTSSNVPRCCCCCCCNCERQPAPETNQGSLTRHLPLTGPLHFPLLDLPAELQLMILEKVIQPWSFSFSTIRDTCTEQCFKELTFFASAASGVRRTRPIERCGSVRRRGHLRISAETASYLDLLQVHPDLSILAKQVLKARYTSEACWFTCDHNLLPATSMWHIPEPLRSMVRYRTKRLNLIGSSIPSLSLIDIRFPKLTAITKHIYRIPKQLDTAYFNNTLTAATLLSGAADPAIHLCTTAWDRLTYPRNIPLIARWHLPVCNPHTGDLSPSSSIFACTIPVNSFSRRIADRTIIPNTNNPSSPFHHSQIPTFPLATFPLRPTESSTHTDILTSRIHLSSTFDYETMLHEHRYRRMRAAAIPLNTAPPPWWALPLRILSCTGRAIWWCGRVVVSWIGRIVLRCIEVVALGALCAGGSWGSA